MALSTIFGGLAAQAKELVNKYAPANLSPEKLFAKSLVQVNALVTMADGEAEDSEQQAASELIAANSSCMDYLGPEASFEILGLTLGDLEAANGKGKVMFNLEVNKILASIKQNVTDPIKREEIIAYATVMGETNSNGVAGPDEQAMIDKIVAALS